MKHREADNKGGSLQDRKELTEEEVLIYAEWLRPAHVTYHPKKSKSHVAAWIVRGRGSGDVVSIEAFRHSSLCARPVDLPR